MNRRGVFAVWKNPWGHPLCLRATVAFLGLATGLWGIRWGLPGRARLVVLPSDLAPSPRTADLLEQNWRELYKQIWAAHGSGKKDPATYVETVEEIAPGTRPCPPGLFNSYRSFLTQSENPDEKKSFIILSQMRPWKLDFKPIYAVYGGAYIYALGIFLEALKLVHVVKLSPRLAFYLLYPEAMGRLYLAGRFFILLFHLGSLGLIYAMGRSLSGEKAGALAAVLYAFCPLVVAGSHLLKPHSYAAFWCLAALHYALKAAKEGRMKWYLRGGLCAGMAMGATFTMVAFVIVPPSAWVLRRLHGQGEAEEKKWAAASAAVALGVWALTNPYFVLSHSNYAIEQAYGQGAGFFQAVASIPATLRGIFLIGLGPVLILVLPCALFFSFRERVVQRRLLGCVFLSVFFLLFTILAVVAPGFVSFARFYYVLAGPACLLAAIFAAACPGNFWAAAVVAVFLADNALRSFVILRNMSLDSTPRSTFYQAASWMRSHLPAGSSLGMNNYPEPAHIPPVRFDRYRLVIFRRPEFLAPARYPSYVVADPMAGKSMKSWLSSHYEVLASFPAYGLGRLWPSRGDLFANESFQIWRLRKSS